MHTEAAADWSVRSLRLAGGAVAGVAAVRAVALIGPGTVIPVQCPFLAITGWQCPFCGSTRAVAALGEGDVAAALGYNPLLLVALALMLVVGVAYAAGRLGRLARWLPTGRTPWSLLAAALVAFTVARNL